MLNKTPNPTQKQPNPYTPTHKPLTASCLATRPLPRPTTPIPTPLIPQTPQTPPPNQARPYPYTKRKIQIHLFFSIRHHCCATQVTNPIQMPCRYTANMRIPCGGGVCGGILKLRLGRAKAMCSLQAVTAPSTDVERQYDR